MKTITLILALLLCFTLNVKANDDTNVSLTQSLSKKVQTALVMPDALKQQSKTQKITIYFAVDENGKVTEVNAVTNNKEAKADLEKQFSQLNFKGLQSCVYNSIDVNFVLY
jgi:hypothetical protein